MLSLRSRGAAARTRMAVESKVPNADPHQLILLLYDGAIAAIQQGILHMSEKRIAEKGAAISKAIQIIDEGLRLSLDEEAGGELAHQLRALYDYMARRLLFASVRGEIAGLDEVLSLLRDLRGARADIDAEAIAQSLAPPAGRQIPNNVVQFKSRF